MKNYNIGLDVGTTSVGWAVVNSETYKVIKKGNKMLWGVRLFESAESAEARRLFRGTRRRFDRRRKRLSLLQEEFKEEINKVDLNFYQKMKESFYKKDDQANKTIEFSDNENKMIKIYYKKYPTIYHLRLKLITSDEKEDIRLVYLAIHHIIKYRGNFLYSNEGFNINSLNIKEQLESIFNGLYKLCEEIELKEEDIYGIDYNEFEKALLVNYKIDGKQIIKQLLSSYLPKSVINEQIKLISGNKFSVCQLFNIELEEDIKLSFKGTEYEDNYSLLEKSLGAKIEILEEFKELYDMIFLKNIFKNHENNSISSLMVDKHSQHKNDLLFLKQFFKNSNIEYNKLFKTIRDSDKIKQTSTDSKKVLAPKEKYICLYERYVTNKLSYDDFIKELNKLLEKALELVDDQELLNKYNNQILPSIISETFLPRITDVDNGKYPYQLNKEELKIIIEKQSKYYPFLLDKTNDGVLKIIKLLEFKIPYYVGPLSNTTDKKNINNPNAWAIKKDSSIAITPYNFNEVIDLEASAEKFITRMLSHCTYITSEIAMAANSILYSKYKVMNELKQIKINGNRMDNEFQQRILNNLFLKTKGIITDKVFKNYLKKTSEMMMYNDLVITGYSSLNKFANNMQSYVDFFGVNGIFENTSYTIDDAEEIIKWITIFEDKQILENKIKKAYKNLSETNIKTAVLKQYKGWSNLSTKLLTNKYYIDKKTTLKKSIMDLMEETDENFMQIISKKEYNFQKMIDEFNKTADLDKVNYNVVKDLATSPSTKKAIYQALKVIEELVKYMGYEPESISIEMARGDEKKERTLDKKKYILNLYKNCENTVENYKKLNGQLNKTEKINSTKLFLYFIQEGKSLYSGKTLNIEDLDDYEIDHIIPRAIIKDDSIDNKTLVFREENQAKADSLVLPSNFRTIKMKTWWEHLNKNGLISAKKYYNLCREKYSKEDIDGFINRQLVETRQITKHIANIINCYHKTTNVIYLHANLSHNYREKFELFKFRDLNNFHHAHDAYLAAVLGEYKTKFLKDVDFYKLKEINQKLIENKEYKKLNYGYVINSIDNEISDFYDEKTGEVKFDADKFNKIVENTLYQNDITISKKTEIKTGQFYNQTKNKKGKSGLRLKDNLPTESYGSYASLNSAYAIVVKYEENGKYRQRVIGIPICIDLKSKSNINIKENYIKNLLELTTNDKIEIIRDKIPFFTVLNWEGQICSLVGATDLVEVCNAKEFKIGKEQLKNWKYTLNRVLNKINNKIIDEKAYNMQLDEIIDYTIKKIRTDYKLYSNLVDSMQKMFDISNNFETEIKEKIVIEMFKLLKSDSSTAQLKFLSEELSNTFGRKNNKKIEHAKIINKSVTGIWYKINEF